MITWSVTRHRRGRLFHSPARLGSDERAELEMKADGRTGTFPSGILLVNFFLGWTRVDAQVRNHLCSLSRLCLHWSGRCHVAAEVLQVHNDNNPLKLLDIRSKSH